MRSASGMRELFYVLKSILEVMPRNEKDGVSKIESCLKIMWIQQNGKVGCMNAKDEVERDLEELLKSNISEYF